MWSHYDIYPIPFILHREKIINFNEASMQKFYRFLNGLYNI